MTGIWKNTGDGWQLADSHPFPDEATLQRLVAENPQLLPLAGSPGLFTLGREVRLGTGYADVLAVEASGRPVIIEVKLARNAEARRAIVSQVLAYAAFLHGYEVAALEQGPLRNALAELDHGSVVEAVAAQDQEGAVDTMAFLPALQEHLDNGRFRLVLVLDEVSGELERIIAYLDSVTLQTLTIDLITINVYEVNGVQIALPQRVSPDVSATPVPVAAPERRSATSRGVLSDGPDAFVESTAQATGEDREAFDQLIARVKYLAQLPKVRLYSYAGAGGRITMLPRIAPGNSGLITIWNDFGKPSLQVWRSVFERLAPKSLSRVEQAISPSRLGQGTTVRDVSPEVLEAITAAYREAVEG